MDKLLDGKVIVVSGGTKGVGKEIIIECARQGAKIVIGGRDQEAASYIIEQVSKFNSDAFFIYTDLKIISDCKNLFDETISRFGKIDGFVNYAGITPVASLTECSEELFNEVFDINIKAAFFCAKYAVSNMIRNNGGSIILIGSPHAWRGEKDRTAYACSKGALITLNEHIAYHYASNHIRCNLVTLGWTLTEGELTLRKSEGISKEELEKSASELLPMGRMIKPEEYVSGIIYLLSDLSWMVTGSNIRMTGGQYI